jgi:tetratricopeptide (TPR) repeat protein
MSAPAVADRGWVFGALPDLLLGCGLGYLLLAGGATLLAADPAALLPWAILLATLTGMPHYGATLLRVYERRADRRRYAFFAVWATLAIWATFVAGVYERTLGSLFVTLYLTWSPWHYTGQNYGLAVLFLRKRGIDVAPATKRWIHASFVASYLLVFLAMHGVTPQVGYGSGLPADPLEHGYRFVSLAIPAPVVTLLFPAVGIAYLGASLVAAARLRRAAAGRALAPALALGATQAAWFVVPASVAYATGVDPRHQVLFFFAWVAVGHQVQYLWITTWYAAGRRPLSERAAYLGKTLLAGAGIWTFPALVFSPALLGTVSYDLGLFLLISAAVNLHHFVLDGAIWKLRDGRVARILLGRPEPADAMAPSGAGGRLVLAACAPLLAIAVAAAYARGVLLPAAASHGDEATVGSITRALAWVGRDEPGFHEARAAALAAGGDLAGAASAYERALAITPTARAWSGLAALRARQGDAYGARQSYERSLALRPTADAWFGIGLLRELEQDVPGALEAYEAALALDASHVAALAQSGRWWLAREEPERGRELLERAASLAPEDPRIRADLARLDSRTGAP